MSAMMRRRRRKGGRTRGFWTAELSAIRSRYAIDGVNQGASHADFDELAET